MRELSNGFSSSKVLIRVARFVALTTAAWLVSSDVIAQTRTFPDGQANLPRQFENINLDLSGRASADNLRAGARLSLPVFSDHFVLFFDTQSVDSTLSGIALGNEIDASGRAQGGGLYITGLPDWRDYTVKLRLSGQNESLDVDSNIAVGGVQAQTRLRNRSVSLALLLSPASAQFANGANTYLAVGASYQRSRRNVVLNALDQPSLYRYEQEYVPYLALGIVYPFKRIRFYAAIDYEQDLGLSLGLRLQLTRTGSKN